MKELISVRGKDATVLSTTEDARRARDELLTRSASVLTIDSQDSAQTAADLLRDMRALLGMIESTRKEVKAPVIERGKEIDALAFELSARVSTESVRIDRMVGAYQLEERRKQQEARQKQWDEEQRIKREAEQKIRDAQATSRTHASAEKKIDRIVETAQQAIVDTRVASASAMAPKLAGIAGREDVVFEITDIQALYEAHAAFVILQPNTSAIKAALKANRNLSLPGVKHRWEARSSVR